jgi:hypothetical protein
MTPADLDRIDALAAAATPGPRTATRMTLGPYGVTFFGDSHWNVRAANPDDPETGPQWTTSGVRSEADALLTAALSPDVVRSLVADARLGAAWREAEAALPEGWWFECYISGAIAGDVNPHTGYSVTSPEQRYVAVAQPTWYPLGPDNDGPSEEVCSEATTPAAALTALAAALRERP